MADYGVVVIGAGGGGLSVGALLAKQGRKVLVLEQSDQIGGCCSTFEKDGYKFDIGAVFIGATNLFDWTMERLGNILGDEVKIDRIPCDPIYSIILKDGTKIKYPTSREETAKEIGKISPEDEKGWHIFEKDMEEFWEALTDAGGFVAAPANKLNDMVALFKKTPKLLSYGSFFLSSYQDVLKRYFKSDKILESFGYQSLYIGLPPEICPGHMAAQPYEEHQGVYYPKGGMIAIPAALKRCGDKLGMELRLKSRVKNILVRNGRAMGVTLADGTEITADVVVSDINAKTLYLDLIGEEHLPWLARVGIKSYEYSVACPVLYLGVDYKPPLEAHHTLATIPLEEMNDSWWNQYNKNLFSPEQPGLISWTSKSDPSLAPKGHHVIQFTTSGGPYRLRGTTWDMEKPVLMEKMIEHLSKKYIPGLAEHVKVAIFSTPLDLERRLLTPEGAIYALRSDVPHSAIFRPAAKSKSIKGLYLVGASTHPGMGVQMVVISGMIAAELIEKYE